MEIQINMQELRQKLQTLLHGFGKDEQKLGGANAICQLGRAKAISPNHNSTLNQNIMLLGKFSYSVL